MSMFFYFVWILFAASVHANDCSLQSKLLRAIEKPANLDASFQLKIGSENYTVNRSFSDKFGEASSEVYVTDDGKHVLKFYPRKSKGGFAAVESNAPAPHREQALYEYWVTKFYEQENIPVVPVSAMPEQQRHPLSGAEGTWIVKKYIQGIAVDTSYKLSPNKLNFFNYVKRKKEIFGPTNEPLKAIYEKLRKEQGKVRKVHDEKKFREFLHGNGIKNPEKTFGSLGNLWKRGDYFKNENWLYTEKGWVLIDP